MLKTLTLVTDHKTNADLLKTIEGLISKKVLPQHSFDEFILKRVSSNNSITFLSIDEMHRYSLAMEADGESIDSSLIT
jgi:hypothetical protein